MQSVRKTAFCAPIVFFVHSVQERALVYRLGEKRQFVQEMAWVYRLGRKPAGDARMVVVFLM